MSARLRVAAVLYRRELKSYFDTPAPYVLVVAALLISGWLFSTPLFLAGRAVLDSFADAAPLLFLFFVPALTMRLYAEEEKSGTAETLAALPARDEDVLAAKALAAQTVLSVFFAASLVYPAVLRLAGRPDLGAALGAYAGLWLLGAAFVSVGVWASTLTRSQTSAFIAAFLGSFVLFMLGKVQVLLPAPLSEAAGALGVDAHLEPFLRGVLTLPDTLYFLSLAAWFLHLAWLGLASRRALGSVRAPRAAAAAAALLTAGCLALANVLAARAPARLDLTEGGLHTLSPGSRRILAQLPGPVEARVYFSETVEPKYAAARSYLRALLADSRRASKGRLSVRFVDVDKDDKAKEEAMQAGVAPVQFNVVSHEKFEVRDGFMGLVLRHADKREVIPVILEPSGLEHELMARLARLSAKSKPVVAFASGAGMGGPAALPESARAALELRAELRSLDLSALKAGATVPADVSALAVLGPQERLGEPAAAALEGYLLSGRPLLVALDPRRADLRAFMASPLETGLAPFLRKLGVQVRSTYVLDAQNQPVQVTQRRGFFTIANVVPYPLFPVSTDLDRSHPLTRDLQSLSLPFAAPLHISSSAAGTAWTVLARSSGRSWVRSAWEKGFAHSISPLEPVSPAPADPAGPYDLAAASEGPFGPGAKPGARLLVVGTSGFARAGLPTGESGPAFLLNAVDWMLQDEDLISIRSKDVAERPLRELSPAAKASLRWACVLLPPLAVVLLGLGRRRARRDGDAARAARYAPASPAAAS